MNADDCDDISSHFWKTFLSQSAWEKRKSLKRSKLEQYLEHIDQRVSACGFIKALVKRFVKYLHSLFFLWTAVKGS